MKHSHRYLGTTSPVEAGGGQLQILLSNTRIVSRSNNSSSTVEYLRATLLTIAYVDLICFLRRVTSGKEEAEVESFLDKPASS